MQLGNVLVEHGLTALVDSAVSAPGSGDPIPASVEPSGLVDQFARAVRTLSALPRPFMAVVDDLQWADPSSLRVIEQTAADLRDVPVLLVVTVRPIDQPSSTPAGRVPRRAGACSHRRGGCRSAGWTLTTSRADPGAPVATDGPGGPAGAADRPPQRRGRGAPRRVRARPHGRQPVLRAGAGGVARRRGPTGLADRHDLADVADLGRRARRGGGRHPPACRVACPRPPSSCCRSPRSSVARSTWTSPRPSRSARRPSCSTTSIPRSTPGWCRRTRT